MAERVFNGQEAAEYRNPSHNIHALRIDPFRRCRSAPPEYDEVAEKSHERFSP